MQNVVSGMIKWLTKFQKNRLAKANYKKNYIYIKNQQTLSRCVTLSISWYRKLQF